MLRNTHAACGDTPATTEPPLKASQVAQINPVPIIMYNRLDGAGVPPSFRKLRRGPMNAAAASADAPAVTWMTTPCC